MTDINNGLLIIGLSNTVLVDGGRFSELLMLNLASGDDLAMPVTDDQAEFLFQQLSSDLAAEQVNGQGNVQAGPEAVPSGEPPQL